MSTEATTLSIRERGAARIAAAAPRTREAWQKAMEGKPDFAFTWGDCWKQCTEYTVDDIAAEIGLYTDVLGLSPMILDSDRGMFTSPDNAFYLTVVAANAERPATVPGSIAIEFMIDDLPATTAELERRGLAFEEQPRPCAPGSPLHTAVFRTPHGVRVTLWAMAPVAEESVNGG
ncbi:MAG TPA: hypothetical protein VHI13_22825 [Candidatus Kapabacteria bacterium]|nr:hypothetical protein [Candidatus Kapabacteria bacterium]